MNHSDPKPRKAPALRLMAVAERLIGDHGYDNVSLVQIAKAAGQGNKYAVQYHFGDKENLVRAIFDDRLARISERRRALLDAIADDNPRDLLRAFIQPVHEEVDSRGEHCYARFAERMLDTPLAPELWFASAHFATTAEVGTRLANLYRHLDPADFARRQRLVSALLLQTLTLIDRERREGAGPDAIDAMLDTAIAMGCASFAMATLAG